MKRSGKYLTFLLGLYVIFLVGMPCTDNDLFVTFPVSAENHHSSGNFPDNCDHCSPFCTCSCCNLPLEISNAIILETPVNHLHTSFVPFHAHFSSVEIFSIWEPPKA